MKGNFLHIGSVVLGFLFIVQSASAQAIPDEEDFSRLAQIYPEEVSQIDAEEASGETIEVTTGNEGSRIRFSDVDRVIPAIQAEPSQQSFSAELAHEVHLFRENVHEEFSVQRQNDQERRDQQNRYNQNRPDQRNQQDLQDRTNQDAQERQRNQQNHNRQNQRDQMNQQEQENNQRERLNRQNQQNQQDRQYQRDQQNRQNQQDQQDRQNQRDQQDRQNQQNQQDRQPQNQQNQNRNQQNQPEWYEDDMNCPQEDSERCYFNDSQKRRCENFGGIYREGGCYMKEDNSNDQQDCEDQGGVYMNNRCYMEQQQNSRLKPCDDVDLRSDGHCSLFDARMNPNDENIDYEQEREDCEDRGGVYDRGTCTLEEEENGSDRQQNQNQRRNQPNNQNWSSYSSDSLLAGIQALVRTEKREKCEDKGGEYLGNGKCIIRHYDQDKCEDKDGTYYNGECFIDSDDL